MPIANLVHSLPKLAYNVYFEDSTQEAVKELDTDIRRTLRATLRTVASPPPDEFLQQNDTFLGGWEGIDVSHIVREQSDALNTLRSLRQSLS